MRIAVYVRKSIYSDSSDSVAVQYKMAVDYCNSRFPEDQIIKYEDEGFSGATSNRPSYKLMIEDIKTGLIDAVVTYKIDRISRNVKDFSDFYTLVESHKISFISLKENVDTSTPLGRAMMYICSIFAQMERETIAERITDNMIALAKSGKWAGGAAPIGYKLKKVLVDGKNHSILEHDEAGKAFYFSLVDIFLSNNFSLSKMATYFKNNGIKSVRGNYFSASQIHAILKNPNYVIADYKIYDYFKNLGCQMVVDKDKFDGQHAIMVYGRTSGSRHKKHIQEKPANWKVSVALWQGIIDSDRWLSIQKRFGQNQINKSRKYDIGILRGILRCSCGRTMRPKRKIDKTYNKIYDRYMCNKRDREGIISCSTPSLDLQEADQLIIDLLKQISLDETLLNKYIKSMPVKQPCSTSKIYADIKKKEMQIEKLVKSLSSAEGSAAHKYIIQEIDNLDKEIVGLKYEILEIEKVNAEIKKINVSKTDIIKSIKSIINNIDTLDYNTLNSSLREIIKTCVWDGENLKVEF